MSKRKLLLADDSITIQKVVNLTFADEGIEVISVGDGDSAMRKFDEFMPDLVMADVNMPGLNGYEVCRIIKVTEETKHIPVILLVGSFEPFDEAEAKDAGADDFLTKPFQSIRQLVNKVTDLLNQSGNKAEPAAGGVDQFAETLEIEKETEAQTAPEFQEIGSEFGDAGMDDEMIETSPANDYLAASESAYQPDTDFGKTQPLSSDDLKGFDILPAASAEQEQGASFETVEPIAGRTEEAQPERAEAASFDEEARKLSYNSPYDEQPETEQREELISETEPEIDYYLPEGGDENREEFEPQLTDAETLAPDIAYTPEEPREADFSQSPVEETGESAEEAVSQTANAPILEFDENFLPKTHEPESAPGYETTESAPTSFNENEYTGYSNAETADAPVSEESGETEVSEEMPPAETRYDETPQDGSSYDEAASSSESHVDEVPQTETSYDETPQTGAVEDTDIGAAEAESDLDDEAESEGASPAAETVTEQPYRASAPSFANFDDGDLLELPPLVEETGIRPQPKAEPIAPAEPEPVEAVTTAETETTAQNEESATPAREAAAMSSFPPELIEAIAQKVAEQISAKTMADVLPQITELVMKKMAEEKSKENS